MPAVWLTNSGTSPVKLQVRVFRWVQQDGQEQLLPTDALMATPPMQELAAGQQQLVRVMRADKEPPAAQQHYRLIVDEVPDLAIRAGGMQFVLRYSIPVFVQPSAGTLAPQLQARLVKLTDGRNGVEVANSGNSYAQIADLALGGATRPHRPSRAAGLRTARPGDALADRTHGDRPRQRPDHGQAQWRVGTDATVAPTGSLRP